MKNQWMVHLEKFRKQNKNIEAKNMMKAARKTYKKGGGVTGHTVSGVANLAGPARGGGGGVTAYERLGLASTASRVGGRKSRRTSRRTKRSRRR